MTREEKRRRNCAIIVAYAAGKSNAEIARTFNVGQRSIIRIAQQAGIAKPRGRPVALPHASDAVLADYRRLRRNYGAATAREMVGAA